MATVGEETAGAAIFYAPDARETDLQKAGYVKRRSYNDVWPFQLLLRFCAGFRVKEGLSYKLTAKQ